MISSGRAHPAVLVAEEAPTLPSTDAEPEAPRRPRLLELGVGLLVVVTPLALLPMSDSPFVDVKLALALVGCLLLWAGGARVDRTLALLAWAWVVAMLLSALAGVDLWMSFAGIDSNAGGLVLLGASAYALVVGTSLPSALVDRVATWLFWTAVPVSIVVALWRFSPDVLAPLGRDLRFDGSTLGHPVFVSGMTAAALAAAVGVRVHRRAWFVVALVAIASALSLSTKRSGLLALAVGLVVALVRSRPGRARWLLIAGVVAGTLAVWTAASAFVPERDALSGVQRFDQLDTDSAAARVHITGAMLRAWGDRPILGWGVGNAWTAYLTAATPADVEVAHRGIADPHNILLGAAATTGVVGLVPLLMLVAVVVRRAWKGPRRLGWAAGAAAALFVNHLLQPLHPALTPLMFLLAGIAAGPGSRGGPVPGGRAVRVRLPARLGSAAAGLLLAAGLVLSTLVLASSVLDKWGRSYNSTWALRAAIALAPGRVWPVQALAVYRAQDAAGGDQTARREALELVQDLIRWHPLDPDVRMIGVQVGLSMNDPAYAVSWLRRQMQVFPSDLASLSPAGLEFLRTGKPPSYAERFQTVGGVADTSSR